MQRPPRYEIEEAEEEFLEEFLKMLGDYHEQESELQKEFAETIYGPFEEEED